MAWPPLHRLREPRFDRRAVTIAPGRSRAYDEHEWRDAIVVIERGAIHNPGREPAVLAAIRRRRATTAG